MKTYEDTAEELTSRIEALIPDNPGILAMDSPWDLFKIPGFRHDDLQPSMFQAAWALTQAKSRHKHLQLTQSTSVFYAKL